MSERPRSRVRRCRAGIVLTRLPSVTGLVVARLLSMVLPIAMLTTPSSVSAATVKVGPTTTVTPTTALTPDAAYSFGTYRTGGNESVFAWSVTFPADTVVAGAYRPDAVVTVSGRTVYVQPSSPIPPRTDLKAIVSGITNPSASSYNMGSITFYARDKQGRSSTTTAATGDYTITPAPSYLALTLSTPDAGQMVDFGNVDPGTTAGPKFVTIQVSSSATYTVTRTLSGASSALGLVVSGTVATGSHPPGTDSYRDAYTLTPAYTTTPEVPLTASVLYTVTQQ